MKKYLLLTILILPIITSAATTISTDITTSGKVGIGSTTPYAKLSIDATSVATGEELIENGTFTGGTTGWTLGSNASYGNNNVVSTYAGGDPDVSTTFNVVDGRTYIISYNISNASSHGFSYFYLNGETSYHEQPPSGNGTHIFIFKATGTGSRTLGFGSWNYYTGSTWTLDDVSVKETSAVTPPLKVMGSNGKSIFNLGEDLLGNLSIGNSSLSPNTTGLFNASYGHGSLGRNTTGDDNNSFGYYSLMSNTTGLANSAIGNQALYSNTTGGYNSAMGFYALGDNTTASFNVGIGYCTLCYNVTGLNNVAIGSSASNRNMSATNTIAIGFEAARGATFYSNQGGVYLGYRSGFSAGNSSDYNTLIGYQSGYGITTGKNNIVLGTATSSTAIANLTTGSQNILIGNNISFPSATASGQLNIGNIIYGTGVTGTGSTMSSAKIGIGTTTPIANFQVANGANATTTVEMGSANQNKGSCLKMYRTDGSAIYAYVAAGATTFTLSTTACASVSNF